MKRNQLKRLKVVALVPMTLIGALGGNVKIYAKEGDGVQQKMAVVQLKKVPDGMELEDITEEEQKEIFNNLHKEPEEITDIKIIEVEEIPDDVKVVEVEEQKANEFVEKVENFKSDNEYKATEVVVEYKSKRLLRSYIKDDFKVGYISGANYWTRADELTIKEGTSVVFLANMKLGEKYGIEGTLNNTKVVEQKFYNKKGKKMKPYVTEKVKHLVYEIVDPYGRKETVIIREIIYGYGSIEIAYK